MTVSDRTHYEVLDADPRATKADLKAAYVSALESAQAAQDGDGAAAVRRAWQVLSDPVQRQRYDDELGLTARNGVAATPDVEVVGDDDEVVEGELVDDDADDLDGDSSVRAERQRLFHEIPEFLEQPTLGRRLVASLIDVVTMVAVFAATTAIFFAAASGDTARTVARIVGFELWTVALFLVPTARTGQTLGKRLTYVMTVDRETGTLPTLPQALLRYLIPMVAVPALGQLGPFLALFFGLSYAMGRDQLSLADRLAKTVVVVARYKPTRRTDA